MDESKMELFELAMGVFCDEPETAESLLRPLVAWGDVDAASCLGTMLTLHDDMARHPEGVVLLERAAAAGNGLAAHNLATYFSVHGSPDRAQELHEVAAATGIYEKTSDPNWWRRS